MKNIFFIFNNVLSCGLALSRHADGQPRCGGGLRGGAACDADRCGAAQAPPTSNTGGLNWRRLVQGRERENLTKLYTMNNADLGVFFVSVRGRKRGKKRGNFRAAAPCIYT